MLLQVHGIWGSVYSTVAACGSKLVHKHTRLSDSTVWSKSRVMATLWTDNLLIDCVGLNNLPGRKHVFELLAWSRCSPTWHPTPSSVWTQKVYMREKHHCVFNVCFVTAIAGQFLSLVCDTTNCSHNLYVLLKNVMCSSVASDWKCNKCQDIAWISQWLLGYRCRRHSPKDTEWCSACFQVITTEEGTWASISSILEHELRIIYTTLM